MGGAILKMSLRSYSFLLFLYYLTEAFCDGKSRVCPGKSILFVKDNKCLLKNDLSR